MYCPTLVSSPFASLSCLYASKVEEVRSVAKNRIHRVSRETIEAEVIYVFIEL
jgi:hypothetical protein